MPWPAIAAIAGKVIGGMGATGAAGGAAAGAGAGASGALGKVSSIAGMMGNVGGGNQGQTFQRRNNASNNNPLMNLNRMYFNPMDNEQYTERQPNPWVGSQLGGRRYGGRTNIPRAQNGMPVIVSEESNTYPDPFYTRNYRNNKFRDKIHDDVYREDGKKTGSKVIIRKGLGDRLVGKNITYNEEASRSVSKYKTPIREGDEYTSQSSPNYSPNLIKNWDVLDKIGYQKGGDIPRAQFGMPLNTSMIDWMNKMSNTGQAAGNVAGLNMQAPQAPQMTAPNPTQGPGMVQNPPASPSGQAMNMSTFPGNQTPNMNNPMAGMSIPVGSTDYIASGPGGMGKEIVGSQGKNDYQTDEMGITKIRKQDTQGQANAMMKGNFLGAAFNRLATTIGGMSDRRRQRRELQQAESLHNQDLAQSSAYNDPNSVYYAAKDGAAINPSLMKQNNNLIGMMQSYQDGGKLDSIRSKRKGEMQQAIREKNEDIKEQARLNALKAEQKRYQTLIDAEEKLLLQRRKNAGGVGLGVGENLKVTTGKNESMRRYNMGAGQSMGSVGGIIGDKKIMQRMKKK